MVIVILGILAATALPKFVDLGKDARTATVNAAKGALSATAAMAHAKYLVTAPAPASIVVEGSTVTFSTAGYPKADVSLAAAAGLNATDYTSSATGTVLTVSPVSAKTPASCYVKYNEAATATDAPTYTVDVTGC